MAEISNLNGKAIIACCLLALIILVFISNQERAEQHACRSAVVLGKPMPKRKYENATKKKLSVCFTSFLKGCYIGVVTGGGPPAALGSGITFMLMPALFGN